jgi:3-hydroxyisobutyrate dehydrogenase
MTDHLPKLGFIGIGLMGQPMCLRLLDAGFALTVHDIDPDRLQPVVARGAQVVDTPAEVAVRSDIVLLCLVSSAAVEQVTIGDRGIAGAVAGTKLIVDFSTCDAALTRRLAAQLKQQNGIGWIDSPVSGGPPAAVAGRLTMMAGGDAADVAQIQPVIDVLAGRFTLMGPVGSGQVTKMINQVLVLNNFCVLAEALRLAENNGIDAGRIPECLAGGHADSTMLKHFFPKMIAREFEPPAGFARQVLKDLDMVYELAKASRTPTPMSDQARMLYRLLNARGYSELDAIAVLKLYDAAPM